MGGLSCDLVLWGRILFTVESCDVASLKTREGLDGTKNSVEGSLMKPSADDNIEDTEG